MAQNSKIEWTHHTANLWWGCVGVHTGCDNCYAEALSKRWGHDVWGAFQPRREVKSVWKDLIKYQKLAKEAGEVHRVFVGSMMDIFEKPMPMINSKGEPLILNGLGVQASTADARRMFFTEIVPNSPNLMFLLLTKRPSNINKYIPESWITNPPDNVMFGTSPVNQETADLLIGQLKGVNGKRFLSIEPQLSEISISNHLWQPTNYCEDCGTGGLHMKKPCDNEDCRFKPIHWIINGGESGHHKRPFNTDWARKLKKECADARIPYFFKQVDKVQAIPDDLKIQEFPKCHELNALKQ